ncbi:unnamed protein product [Urochloa decumbens]|uniref:DUF1618 domain-containing protein n=1 Tax=Urochloa decumbens TaxID=240449 RepID=A0ABC8Y2F9_9POAL
MDPPKAFMVMEILLKDPDRLADADGAPGPTWERIYCSRKVAYGCGKHGRKLVEGLTLYVRRRDHPNLTSSMTIRLSDEAVRSVKAELGASRSRVESLGFVKIANQGLLVLHVTFRVHALSRCEYYLVYDSTDASLYMIPCLPTDDELVASFTSTPVPRRVGDGGQDPQLQLVLMAHWIWPHQRDRDLLCLCTPATSSSSSGIVTDPWVTRVRRFPHLPGSFKADLMFSFEGKVVWADLSRGLAYCDLRGVTGNSAVQFDFIELPYGYQILSEDLPEEDELKEPPEMNRTIGCVGGCIKFICIDRPRNHPANVMVRAWTLDLRRKEWKAEMGLLWKELWKQVEFMFMDHAELWDVEPRYPVLMPDETLCLVLRDMRPRRREPPVEVDRICSFDMRSKRPLWDGIVRYYDTMWPVILPANFFTKCFPPPGPHESKLPARKRKR